MNPSRPSLPINQLRSAFNDKLQENVVMANYTTARVGGVADAVLIAQSAFELESIVRRLWELETPFLIFGSGSNVLVSDAGIRKLVVINRAHTVKIDSQHNPPSVWAESGANLGNALACCGLR